MSKKTPSLDGVKAAEVFLAHYDFVKGVAFRFAPEKNLAEDIVQQVFIAFVTGENRWEVTSNFQALLWSLTRNIALKQWKEYRDQLPDVRQRIADHLLRRAEAVENEENHESEIKYLRDCLDGLNDKSRALIDSYYFQNETVDSLACRWNLNPQTLRKIFSRIREKLRFCIKRNMQRKKSPS